MPIARPSPAQPAPSSYPWSENTRGIVSVLLVVHLLALGFIFWLNNDYNPGPSLTVLSNTKQKVFNKYLFPLWLDRKWDNKLVNGDDIDSDHYLRFVAKTADGKMTEARFPKAEGNLPEERERWQQFANDLAREEELGDGDTSGNDERIKLLAKSWLAQQREAGNPYDAVTIEVRRRIRIRLDGDRTRDPFHPDFNPAPPYGEQRKILYPIEVLWPGGEGEPFLRKLGGDKRDEAPVVPAKPTTTATSPAQPIPQPQPMIDPKLIPAPNLVSPPAINTTPTP
jgi:hypothetical protein